LENRGIITRPANLCWMTDG